MRNRGLWYAYVDGVLNYVNHGAPETGMSTASTEAQREREAARRQGYYDAEGKRVMLRTEFDREKLLRRVEIREAQ